MPVAHVNCIQTASVLSAQVSVMLSALRAKFEQHAAPRAQLLATAIPPGAHATLIEASPNDYFWGAVRC